MTTRTYRPTAKNLQTLARLLARGQLVAAPTETVYGLAADALNPEACEKIFAAKNRPANDPLIIHIATLRQAAALARINPAAEKLAKKFWPGPLTLVLPKTDKVPPIVTSGLPSVAIRMPAHPHFRKLIQLSKRPLAAPSANPFGYVSPTTAAHVKNGLDGKIPAILDGGPCAIGLESTILDLRNPAKPVLLRPGAISREEISKLLKRPVRHIRKKSPAKQTAVLAPGLLTKHYSPKTPLNLVKKISARQAAAPCLFFQKPDKLPPSKNHFYLTTNGNLSEAAQNLFAQLRALDKKHFKEIHVELAPGKTALALAINDRLTRAAAKT